MSNPGCLMSLVGVGLLMIVAGVCFFVVYATTSDPFDRWALSQLQGIGWLLILGGAGIAAAAWAALGRS